MTGTKKIPMRTCTGCRQSFPKKELVRVVLSPEGELSVDLTGKKSGRGAYICKNAKCLRAARKGRRLENALGTAIPDEVYGILEEQINED